MSSLLVGVFLVSCLQMTWAAQVCCPDAGCFTDDPPFDGLPLPECAEEINITMQVYTRTNPTNGEYITRDTIPPSYDGSRRTIFFVHGWLGTEDNGWLHDLKDAALQQGDYNAIIVGWEEGAQQIWYPQSASDTRTVGTEIGLVASNVIANGGSAQDRLYCVGHSLGSHCCGHAGMHTMFGRITGMDPAGPLFEDRDWTCGLNPGCADLVDAIHTHGQPDNIMNLGTMKVLGHVDFYPNSGYAQPGCDSALDPVCNHFRAVYFYLESILTPCFLSRDQCTDQYDLPGSCTNYPDPVQNMGFESEQWTEQGIFYLQTNAEEPYCMNLLN